MRTAKVFEGLLNITACGRIQECNFANERLKGYFNVS